jgi:hypothetical protein
VEAIVVVDPELVGGRNDPQAAPLLGQGRIVAELRAGVLHPGLELGPVTDRAALRRRPRREPSPDRAAAVVRLRILTARALDGPFDADLATDLAPVEEQRRPRVRRHLFALAAAVVGVEDEAALVDALEQHHPHGGRPGRICGGQCHRLGERRRVPRLAEPGLELPERIRVQVALVHRLSTLRHRLRELESCDRGVPPSVGLRSHPSNLIWVMPAKGAE